LALSYTPIIASHAKEYVDELLHSEQGTKVSLEFDVVDGLKLYPFITVAHILFGRLSKEQQEKLVELVPGREELFRLGIKGGINRTVLAPLLRTKAFHMLKAYQEAWRAFVVHAYEQSRAQGQGALVEELWDTVQANNGLTEQEVYYRRISRVVSFRFANQDLNLVLTDT
jgi:hypothetical protein